MAWCYEIEKYIPDPRADSTEDILEWRKRHECIFPNLAAMAKDFLATPASSTPVERQFSRVVCMCLKSWMANE
ncbi:unnamed protein product, partial [Callosobruchus maculatus]